MQILRQQITGVVQSVLTQALDTVLPPRCVVNGEIVEVQGMISPQAWSELDFIGDPMCASCGFPFDFEVEEGSLCAGCLEHPPPYEKARSALTYNDISRDIILGFKHADKTHLVKAFVPWLRRAGQEMLQEADMIVPVPLHRRRLLARRYNQAALIAKALAKEQGLQCEVDLLERVKATPSQGHLRIKERYKNVRRAFALNPKAKVDVKGKTVLLIDDVYTTGATVKECTKVLLKAGASKVYVLALARVVRDGY